MGHDADWLYPERNFISDRRFDRVYPEHLRKLSEQHWTPVHVARKAAHFLVPSSGAKVLDIGSGTGKFCFAAAFYKPDGRYYGVEQRSAQVEQAELVRERLGFEQVSFIHANFTQLDFSRFDHFYFYNSFYENLPGTQKIDESLSYSEELFHYYNRFLCRQLELKPAGTRLVTFNSLEYEVPASYFVVHASMNDLLKCWIKI
ncbi:MAG: methyltransferase domain-containing protein [Chitinophagaceae bacterium]